MDDEEDGIPTLDEQDQADVIGPGVAIDEAPPVGAQFAAQPIMLSGPQGPVPVAAPPVAQNLLTPEVAANRELLRRLQYNLKDTPIAEAEGAVNAALRFQALRQYQNDISTGVNPAVALARSAPLMFAGPKQSNLGQAANFLKATGPGATTARLINAGGIIYRQNPDGSVTAITQAQDRVSNAGGILYKHNPDGSVTPLTTRRSPADQALLKRDVERLKLIEEDRNLGPRSLPALNLRRSIMLRYGDKAPLAVPGITAPPQTGTQAPPAQVAAPPQARVRVIGPNGRTGTAFEGKPLPPGWRIAK